jgi:UDP-glucuronate 4-epimerase
VDNFDPFYKKEIKMGNIKHNSNNPNFHFFECDIRDSMKVEKIIRDNEIRRIVHLAARPGVRPSIEDPLLYQNINIGGTIALLEIARKCDIENFVFGSSSSVYGVAKTPFKETQDCRPISPYGSSKISCEFFCSTYNHLYKIPTPCLRFFTVYGPRQRPEMAIHKFTRLIDNGKPIEVYGDGSSKRDYTYVR